MFVPSGCYHKSKATMLQRFPYSKTKADDQYLKINHIPYALLSIEKTAGKKNVFLTEHTLLFVLNGTKSIHIGDENYCFKNDELVFLKKGIYVMSEFIPADEKFE